MMPIPDAARALGIGEATLRRWIQRGCPVASRGRRGRGLATLVCPDAVRTWRQAGEREAVLMELASALPGVLAGGIEKAHQLAEGTDKRRLAGTLAATWFLATAAILETLHEHCPAIAPDPRCVPGAIERLRKIAAG